MGSTETSACWTTELGHICELDCADLPNWPKSYNTSRLVARRGHTRLARKRVRGADSGSARQRRSAHCRVHAPPCPDYPKIGFQWCTVRCPRAVTSYHPELRLARSAKVIVSHLIKPLLADGHSMHAVLEVTEIRVSLRAAPQRELATKLIDFQHSCNGHRTHAAPEGRLPEPAVDGPTSPIGLDSYRWRRHCQGFYQTPIAHIISSIGYIQVRLEIHARLGIVR
jgi:hypothetical protein